jgi:hypothetical protein
MEGGAEFEEEEADADLRGAAYANSDAIDLRNKILKAAKAEAQQLLQRTLQADDDDQLESLST